MGTNLPTRITIVIIIFFLLGIFPGVVVAEKKTGIEVNPAFVDISVENPQEEKEVTITYTNHNTHAISVDFFPINFKQENDTGKISFLGQNSENYSYALSSFLTFEKNRLNLNPGETDTLLVKIKNRQDLSPGGHYAAVVGRLVDDTNEKGLTNFAPAVSSLLLVHKVGGERFALSLKDINFPTNIIETSYPFEMEFTFQNEGNIHMVPYGQVQITDNWGRTVSTGVLNISSARIFPESRRIVSARLNPVNVSYPIAINTITVTGRDSLNKSTYTRRETYLYINPWISVLPISLIVLGILVMSRKKKKKHL